MNTTFISKLNRMQEYIEKIEKLHKDIQQDNSAKFRECRENNQHSFWEPEMIYKKKEKHD